VTWISVEDRLPLGGYGVILCVCGKVQYGWLRSWAGPKASKWRGVNYVITGEVTHWMPLPDPPESA
jgi:Protein of unknown function (DUF551)